MYLYIAMLKLILFIFGCFVYSFTLYCTPQENKYKKKGPGLWSLLSISACSQKTEDVVSVVDINILKVNRTHDAITADVKLSDDVGDNYGARVDICKFVNAGCRANQVLTDVSVANMLKEYIKEENIVNAFKSAKIDPPDFPVPKGEYHMDNFMMNFCLLPRSSAYGRYVAVAYLMRGPEKVGCIQAVIGFNKLHGEKSCDD